MAILTKDEILARVKKGNIVFTPGLDRFQLQTHAVDLRLGFTFLIPKAWKMTPKGREALRIDPLKDHGPEYFDVIELEQGQYFELLPQEYVLVSTFETIKVPNDLMCVLYPRSSVNRKGLSVDLTGIIDSGYEGPLTLPVKNNTRSQTIQLHPGERFCQVVFEELKKKVTPRKSRWHGKDVVDKAKKEKAAEMKLVGSGDIRKLKSDFPAA
ncbi:dCTP deaminase [Candidatus Kaiserbacteria bacterium RIFCSPLOWO2_01_FULL_54_13]|uniref:dCTP deaminase n=1 Tax=Candidatus Kaiserbacteria bacterium RIFCSPLOWO2_01_FULL_54_13 TaxID=1798512 RepID=A0A1F6F1D8_9BACT|nr:MAG: dCTP deaminase [Candidatus Kaiserbacteria bacterium RIFCSPLOWO2_01_FULL_54_13]